MVKYYTPSGLDDALLALKNGTFLPYAGGTDINSAGIRDRDLLFIGKLPELRHITEDGTYIRLGAAVTYAEAEESPLIPELMKTAIRKVASPAVRNLGTFGGNLANGSGKADSALVDLVLDARLLIRSADASRTVDAARFYRGYRDVDLKPDELICEILIPKKNYYINYYYDKVSVRSSIAISNLSIASVWHIQGGVIKDLSIGIGSATDFPVRCTDIEQALLGKRLSEVESIRETLLSRYVVDLDLPLDRTGISYRRQVCFRLLNYLVQQEFSPLQ